jgi:hypothetical protein
VFSGVNQTTPFGSFATATGNSAAPSVNATSAAADVVIDVLAALGTPTATAGSGQAGEWNQVTSGSPSVRGAGSTKPGAASVTMSYTLSGSGQWAIGAIALKPSNPTAVKLLSFAAAGDRGRVQISWQTAQEANNKGFNLYRAEAVGGVYVKLNAGLILAASLSGEGRSYRYTDGSLAWGHLYYYKLEDVDVSGAVTVHGPICVDWDADGMPDDWEIAHGLNPAVNDANLDLDGDGVPNWLEYQRGTDPFNPDTDGDGIPDGAEKKSPVYSGRSGSVDLGESVQVISSDDTGMTLELLTRSFDTTLVQVGGQAFERLRVPAYVHGFTQEVGKIGRAHV